MSKRRLTAIKFDKQRLITKFGYLDCNKQKVTHERMIFNADSLADEVERFLRGLAERHYPVNADDEFLVNTIAIDYQHDEPSSLMFSLKFSGEECGEMCFNFPSLPSQILTDNSDLIEKLSDLALEFWDDFQDSLPKQGDLFAMPDLRNEIEVLRNVEIEVA